MPTGKCVSGKSDCEKGCIEESEIYGNYTWPNTKAGVQANIECFYNKDTDDNMAYKNCDENGKFEKTDFGNCESKVNDRILPILDEAQKINSTKAQNNVSENIKDVAEDYSASMTSDDINNVANILDMIVNYKVQGNDMNRKIRSNVLKTINSVHSSTSPEEMANGDAASGMRNSTVKFTNRISKESNNPTYYKENTVAVAVVPFGEENMSFSITGNESNLATSQFNTENSYKGALFSAKVPGQMNKTLASVIYNSNNFYPERKSQTAKSVTHAVTEEAYDGELKDSINKVVSIIAEVYYADTVERMEFENGMMIEMNFTVNKQPKVTSKFARTMPRYECAFYNMDAKVWVTGHEFGCITSVAEESVAKKRVNCKCSHMTSFAVLMSFHSGYDPLEGVVTSILLGTSLGCLILTILAYLPAKQMLQTRPVRINLLMVTSLIFSILVFFSKEHLTTADEEKGYKAKQRHVASFPCTIVAFLMNYFWLCQMAWMVCGAVVMYKTLVRNVFNSYITKYMLKFNLACWGIPLVFPAIGIIWGQSNFANPETCFLRKKYGLATFYAPLICCILFNTNIFIRLSKSVLWKDNGEADGLPAREKQKKRNEFKFAITVMTMFGLTWTFGFFLIFEGINTIWLRWLFIICNSSQGMLIFYLNVLQNNDLKRIWKNLLCISNTRNMPHNIPLQTLERKASVQNNKRKTT